MRLSTLRAGRSLKDTLGGALGVHATKTLLMPMLRKLAMNRDLGPVT